MSGMIFTDGDEVPSLEGNGKFYLNPEYPDLLMWVAVTSELIKNSKIFSLELNGSGTAYELTPEFIAFLRQHDLFQEMQKSWSSDRRRGHLILMMPKEIAMLLRLEFL